MQRKAALHIAGVTRHQYYYKSKQGKRGRRPTCSTARLLEGCMTKVPNTEVIAHIHSLKNDPDTDHGYQKTARLLMLHGYYIGPKKTHRLMEQEDLLAPRRKAPARKFVKYRVVTPERPLHVLEMDIKSTWLMGERRQAYILTILDTFTRQGLHWQAGLSMTQHQVKQAWDRMIEHHLQPADLLGKGLHLEIRNDNGPQFIAKMVQAYFKENHLDQVFTHPYTPQERTGTSRASMPSWAPIWKATPFGISNNCKQGWPNSMPDIMASASMVPRPTSGRTCLNRLGMPGWSSDRWTAAIALSSSSWFPLKNYYRGAGS